MTHPCPDSNGGLANDNVDICAPKLAQMIRISRKAPACTGILTSCYTCILVFIFRENYVWPATCILAKYIDFVWELHLAYACKIFFSRTNVVYFKIRKVSSLTLCEMTPCFNCRYPRL